MKLLGTGANYLSGRVGGWVGGQVALEEWKLRLTSAKVEVEVEAELGYNETYYRSARVQSFLIVLKLFEL